MKHLLVCLIMSLQLLIIPIQITYANPQGGSVPAGNSNTQSNTPQRSIPVTNVQDFLPDNAPGKQPGGSQAAGIGATDIVEQGTGEFREGNIGQLDVAGTIKNILSLATGALASVAGLYAVFMVLKHAFAYATSQGDSGKVGDAQKGIRDALIALLIISFSYLIVITIINTVGLLAGLSS